MKQLQHPSSTLPLFTRVRSLAVVLALGAAAGSGLANDFGVLMTSKSLDLGAADPAGRKTITLTLQPRNASELEAEVTSVSDPASVRYRHFITPSQFAARYGQTQETVTSVVNYLRSQGFEVDKVYSNNLMISASATNAQLAATFSSQIDAFRLGSTLFEAPRAAAVMPSALRNVVVSIDGLGTLGRARSHLVHEIDEDAIAAETSMTRRSKTMASAQAGGFPHGSPGTLTVRDVARRYNVEPLYAKGMTGLGRTVGIATFGTYQQSDVFRYWRDIGLIVDPSRITDIAVDGGADAESGPGTDAANETTLDVAQSGGLAPDAKVRVYIGPNTSGAFIDVIAHAVDEDVIDVLSISWGGPERLFLSDTQRNTLHTLFAQAALQGIPVIAAAGDAGAYDVNRSERIPLFSSALSVDYPASDPLVLAAGGTTEPTSLTLKYGQVLVPAERAWGWDYLKNYYVTYYGLDKYLSKVFAVGGGGGVSLDFPLPSYQAALPGTAVSARAQSLVLNLWNAPLLLTTLPAGFAGRNVPDLSLNADPNSGYLLYADGAYTKGQGGTSFVAPQLNGIFTAISQGIKPTLDNRKGRIGFLNPSLYAAFKTQHYGAGSPFRPIAAGGNQYWKSSAISYNPATGLGSADFSVLATTLGAQ